MIQTLRIFVFFVLTMVCLNSSTAPASNLSTEQGKTAILLASFGTTLPGAVEALTNIRNQVKNAYPETELRITFTSNMIRSVWKKRRAEPQKWLDLGVPSEILNVKNIIQTMGDLQEDGYTNIVVQPTHMFFMEQSHDLHNYVMAIGSIRTLKDRWKPFDNVVFGRPALGMPGDRYSYHDDITAFVKTLADDAEEARREGAMLVYMGHGNSHWSTGIYGETQKKMREVYPDVETFIGVVEGSPSLYDLMADLKRAETQKVILRPFLITAGDHATNDMAGPYEDSWKSVMTSEGFEVRPILKGLGSNDDFAALFVKHISDAAAERGIELK
jgi:sirohydrochlorin cobaltochelatase